MRRNQNFLEFLEEKVSYMYVFRLFDFWNFFFRLSFSPFPFFLLQWLTFYWACLQLKKLLRKWHRDRQFLACSSQVYWQEILLRVFHSTFWAFLCTSKAPFSRSLWSGYDWKDLFLQQKLSIDDANFCQKWWRQKSLSRAVTGGTGVNGLK